MKHVYTVDTIKIKLVYLRLDVHTDEHTAVWLFRRKNFFLNLNININYNLMKIISPYSV